MPRDVSPPPKGHCPRCHTKMVPMEKDPRWPNYNLVGCPTEDCDCVLVESKDETEMKAQVPDRAGKQTGVQLGDFTLDNDVVWGGESSYYLRQRADDYDEAWEQGQRERKVPE